MDTTTKQDVIDLVRKYVERHQPNDYRLIVPDDGIRFVSDGVTDPSECFIVAVIPEGRASSAIEYVDRLMRIERDITANEEVRVSVLPAMPG